jgi:uncharacterized membrane protein
MKKIKWYKILYIIFIPIALIYFFIMWILVESLRLLHPDTWK